MTAKRRTRGHWHRAGRDAHALAYDDWCVLHLVEGTERNAETLPQLVRTLNRMRVPCPPIRGREAKT
jgi:hypothetical protein